MGLSHPACHNELATNKYILPQELRTLAGEAADLRNALIKIQARFPPISSIYPELYREIQNVPRCSTNKQRVERSGSLVTSLGLLYSWFPEKDISREDVIYVVHRIEGESEGSVALLNDLKEIDRRQSLPKHHPDHSSYIKSLIQRLEHLRKLWSEVEAALSIAGKKSVVPSMSSFANELHSTNEDDDDDEGEPTSGNEDDAGDDGESTSENEDDAGDDGESTSENEDDADDDDGESTSGDEDDDDDDNGKSTSEDDDDDNDD